MNNIYPYFQKSLELGLPDFLNISKSINFSKKIRNLKIVTNSSKLIFIFNFVLKASNII